MAEGVRVEADDIRTAISKAATISRANYPVGDVLVLRQPDADQDE